MKSANYKAHHFVIFTLLTLNLGPNALFSTLFPTPSVCAVLLVAGRP